MNLEIKIKRAKQKRRVRAVILILLIFLYIKGSTEIISSPANDANITIRVEYDKVTSTPYLEYIFFGKVYYWDFAR